MFLNVQDPIERLRIQHDYLQKASELKINEAKYELGKIYIRGSKTYTDEIVIPQDRHQAINLFNSAIEKNNVSAICFMAECYENGSHGLRRNFTTALNLWEKAYDLNSSHAVFSLVPYYRDGLGGAPNTEKWVILLEKLAEKQCPDAIATLAWLHIKGTEVEQDFKKAEELLNRIEGNFNIMPSFLPFFIEDFVYIKDSIYVDYKTTKRRLLDLITQEKNKTQN